MPDKFYPIASPDIGPLEEKYAMDAIRSGWISSIGSYVNRFENDFAAWCGVNSGVSVANGTDALFITLKTLGVGPGDEVVVPGLTFAAVPAVVCHVGAAPVLVDVHPEYWCMDPRAVERAITPETKAIIVVHSYGHPVDMDPILNAARLKGIRVIEDCAEAHGAQYRGQKVGTMGDLGCFSFYGNKIITTGEGGMIIADDNKLIDRARFLKDHAMDPHRRYYHSEAGFNCRMTNVQAAIGCAQLERVDKLLSKRQQIMTWYRENLSVVGDLILNPSMDWANPVNWMVCAQFIGRTSEATATLTLQLRERGIDTRPFFVPLHLMPPYKKYRTVSADSIGLPVAEQISCCSLNLPSSLALTREDVQFICDEIKRML